MNRFPKRLIEIDLPIRKISEQARAEKAIRQGHISSLHIWWARRPLIACRAILCASLWLDPWDENCPQSFRDAASYAIGMFSEQVRTDRKLAELCKEHWGTRWSRTNLKSLNSKDPAMWADLRYALLDFISDFSSWDASVSPAFLKTARFLSISAHNALLQTSWDYNDAKDLLLKNSETFLPESTNISRPYVIDPFAGGGAIPLEALRVGANAFASDLNPVAVLLNKVTLEYIPRFGTRLVEEVRTSGDWVKKQLKKDLGKFYPASQLGPDSYAPTLETDKRHQGTTWVLKCIESETPITYIWARTILCEGPGCGVEVPLTRSLWLSKKSKNTVGLRIVPNNAQKRVDFEIINKVRSKDIGEGTVRRGSVTCPICGYTTPVDRVRSQLKEKNGGAADARLLAIACTLRTTRVAKGQKEEQSFDETGRYYRLPTESDIKAVSLAAQELLDQKEKFTGKLSLIPEETLPLMSGVFNAPIYGHNTWASLFSSRQMLAMVTLVKYVRQLGSRYQDKELAKAVQTLLAFALDKQADLGNALNRWEPIAECPRQLFGRQAIPMIWDFAEGVPIGETSGAFIVFVDGLVRALENIGSDWLPGHVEQASAAHHPLPDDSANCVFTDPPYYNAVPYADLSDFFYLWLQRTVGDIYPDLFKQNLAPKDDEICEMAGWDPVRYPHKDSQWFVEQMTQAMKEARRVLAPGGIGIVVFAHKSTSGWESQLQAMIDAGWTITSSWPIDTENTSRLRAQGSAALSSSIHLVCRPREGEDGSVKEVTGDWRDVLSELPDRIKSWLPRLSQEGVVGADAIFACLGPALEIYSRYSRVEKASGEQVGLKQYLEIVWAAVAREALSMIFEGADTTGFEEDARLTAMWLWTLSTQGEDKQPDQTDLFGNDEDESGSRKSESVIGYVLEYDAARKIAQGLGAHMEQLESLIEIKGDKARLRTLNERAHVLFGNTENNMLSGRKPKKNPQLGLFDALELAEGVETRWGDQFTPHPAETTLDRLHQSMLLFAAGRNEAIKRFLIEEGVGKDQRFWRLAQALSALYPSGSDEKRWVDGVLARKKGLGF